MKFLVLAFGDEAGWNALPRERQAALLAQDEVLRRRGDLVAIVERPTTVRVVDGRLETTAAPFAKAPVPLAGFGLVEADTLEDAIALVARTPCPNAGGAVEVWPVRIP